MDHGQTLNSGASSNIQSEKAELPDVPIIGDVFTPK